MKVSLEQIKSGEDEVIIRYKEETELVKELTSLALNGTKKILVNKGNKGELIIAKDILYMESVDGNTYVYTKEEVYTLGMTLVSFTNMTLDKSFFRCSKSMIINIRHITELKSLSGNRIDAKLSNDEHIIISRRYAKEFREILKNGN